AFSAATVPSSSASSRREWPARQRQGSQSPGGSRPLFRQPTSFEGLAEQGRAVPVGPLFGCGSEEVTAGRRLARKPVKQDAGVGSPCSTSTCQSAFSNNQNPSTQ